MHFNVLKHIIHREHPSYGKLVKVGNDYFYLKYKHKEINKNKPCPKFISELTFEYKPVLNLREFYTHYKSVSLEKWIAVETLDYLTINNK